MKTKEYRKNFLDISNIELERIINLLTDYKLDYNNYGKFELINNNKKRL